MPRRYPVAVRIGVLAAVVLLALALGRSGSEVGSGAFEGLWFLVLFIVVIPLHEVGHAIVGALVGFRIVAINIGFGPELLAFDAFGARVRLNALPLGGMTLTLPRRSEGWAPLRMWLLAAGGPAANLLIYLLLRRLYGHALDVEGSEHHFAAVAMAANWGVVIVNLIPFKTTDGAASDGYLLFTIPFWGPERRAEARVTAEGAPALEAMRRGNLAEAERLVGELRARHPDRTGPMLLAGNVLHRRGNHEAARAIWREGLAREKDPGRLGLFRNNVAFVDALIGDEDGLREADLLSEAALTARPDQPAFAGTRGSVLLRLGRPAEALPLLQRSAAAFNEPHGAGYGHAFLASALATLGRAAEARRELDEARRADPSCDLLPVVEAELAALAAGGPPPQPAPDAQRLAGLAGALARAGGIVRWGQLARGAAFLSALAPPRVLGDANYPALLAAIAVVLSPHPVSLTIFGVCNLALAAVRLVDASGYGAGDVVPLWTALVPFAFGLFALVLAPVRDRLGPRQPSKGPVVLGWLLGLTAVVEALRVAAEVRQAGIRHVDPPELARAVSVIGFAVVLASSRRRWARALAVLPIGLAAAAAVGAWNGRAAHAFVNHIPEDGAPLRWEAPRTPKALRARQVSVSGYDPVVSPGGRAFLLHDVVTYGPAKGQPRRVIRVGGFEGPLLEVDGDLGAFVDDTRLVVVRDRRADGGPLELAEIHPASGPDPVWTRPLAELRPTQVVAYAEADGQAIVLAGHGFDTKRFFVARAGLGASSKVEVSELATAHPGADVLVSAFTGSAARSGGALVSRRRQPQAAPGGVPVYVAATEQWSADADVELWRLGPEREALVAGRIPRPRCPFLHVGDPVLWCVAATTGGSLLLKIDLPAGRLARVGARLPHQTWGARLGPARLALVMGTDVNLVDVETRRATWLHFADQDALSVVRGGPLATFSRADENAAGNLVVYETP